MWLGLFGLESEFMAKDSSSGGGVGFVGLLTILFIGLKLAGVIMWSWFWVLSPILILALSLTLLTGVVVAAAVAQRKR